jgi:molybdate transport system permease protein
VQLYDHVEALAYAEAHGLALLLLGFSFLVLVALYALQSKGGHGHARPANGQVMP